MSDGERERAWAQRAAAGDPVSLTLLLAAVEPTLAARLAPRIPPDLRGVVDAEDVVQAALATVTQSLTNFTWRGPDAFGRWVTAIALRQLRDWVRSHRSLRQGGGRKAVGGLRTTPSGSYVQLLDELAAAGHTPSRSAARLEAAAALHAALRELPEPHRRAVELVYLEGWSVAAVAAELGRTEGAIHHLCQRAREQLRGLLGDAGRFLSGAGPI